MNNLIILEENRASLLLAEAVGWLHDYRKCSEEQLKNQAKESLGQALERDKLNKKYPRLGEKILNLSIGGTFDSISLINLLNDKIWGKEEYNGFFCNYLSRCHNSAHFDKQDLKGGKQAYPGTKISTPFGFEKDVPDCLTKKLWALPWNDLLDYTPEKRKELREKLEALFSEALADTRRPINEVDLWSWGLLVGSLYKAALAGALLTEDVKKKDELTWRLLGVRFKGLDYISEVSRIPDLLARQDLLRHGLDRVRELLEITYPLGSEVYRDENGSVYVVPDLEDLLQRTDGNGKSLETLIKETFQKDPGEQNVKLQVEGEIQPHIKLEEKSWHGQDPKDWRKYQLPEIGKFLSAVPISQADPNKIRHFWQQHTADVCAVCGLRPQGPGRKSTQRSVCDVCEKRRSDRSKNWAENLQETIWTEEVADVNGRVALVVGQFELTHWLDGVFLSSLFVIEPDPGKQEQQEVSKTPSFSRLRRIWETTRRFWQEVRDEVLETSCTKQPRLKIYLSAEPKLGDYHVYDLVLGSVDLDVVWIPSDKGTGCLLSAANLEYIARRLGAKETENHLPEKAADYIKKCLEQLYAGQPVLRNPEGRTDRKSPNLLEGITITRIDYEETPYAPVIPLLAEPRAFMMLVPACSSLRIIEKIKEKYEREMGKVKDRLPLSLGLVHAGRRIPVRSLLEAGRALLDKSVSFEIWRVGKDQNGKSEIGASMEGRSLLILEQDRPPFRRHFPFNMKDKNPKDPWYPYLFLAQKRTGKNGEAVKRREAEATLPLGKNQTRPNRVVHAANVEEGDQIYFYPSTFDFEFLDTNGRRFEIYYDQEGRRPRRTRPFYLEGLDCFKTIWNCLQHLSKTQRHQLIRTIECVREDWYGQDAGGVSYVDEVFSRFVADTLAGAAWPRGKKWEEIPERIQRKLVKAGVWGELADLAELHMEILKQ
ncbi:CRISPR-associated protein Csx11 [Desulforamulus ruminis]|uniref:CRISPR-associated protein Csx11 n=1 Tax=Desulforamulus ruminis TaxID=1564 RepID=UPI002355E241|nr:CRISPR-associated protein Csx11 [Desulforamulus ruminis]